MAQVRSTSASLCVGLERPRPADSGCLVDCKLELHALDCFFPFTRHLKQPGNLKLEHALAANLSKCEHKYVSSLRHAGGEFELSGLYNLTAKTMRLSVVALHFFVISFSDPRSLSDDYVKLEVALHRERKKSGEPVRPC